MIFSVIFSGCLLFDAGFISRTCEDFYTCDEQSIIIEPSQDSADVNDTSINEPDDEIVVEYDFHPNEFTIYVEQSIFDQNVVNHQSWENQVTIVLFERDDMETYPKLDMDACLLFLDFDAVEEVEPNAQSFFGYDIKSFDVSHDIGPESKCSEMDPSELEAYKTAVQAAQWSIGIGDITNSIYVEYDSWIEQNERELLETESNSEFSDPFDFISTLYIKSDWSGSMVTLAPGVTLSFQSNAGGSINQNLLNVLQGIINPPDGFYFSRALFPYTLFDAPVDMETETLDE